MELVFVTEARFEKSKDGKIYSTTGSYALNLWKRYLSVFCHLYVIARVNSTEKEYPIELLAESEEITFIPLPYYVGTKGYLKNKREIEQIISEQAIEGRCYICRVPGVMGAIMAKKCKKAKIPYAVEVVGDPQDVFAPKAFKSPLRPLLRVKACLSLKKTILQASAALYVTKSQLQKRYPTRIDVFSTNASNVNLPDDSIMVSGKAFKKDSNSVVEIISVGSLEQMYKSPDVVISAIKILSDKGVNCRLTWLGDGVYKNEMVRLSDELGVRDKIIFLGKVLPSDVRKYLLNSDLFILASRTEGLPRAMIEAMAVGLPCIGTNVGGIPELLDTECLVPPNDAKKLSERIFHFISNPSFMASQSNRNLTEAASYKQSILNKRREDFYRTIINISK